jgi:hypothetical protein
VGIILLHVHLLLGNALVNKLPRRQILGKQSVAMLRNNRGGCVFRVRGDVTQPWVVVTWHVLPVMCVSVPWLCKWHNSFSSGAVTSQSQAGDVSPEEFLVPRFQSDWRRNSKKTSWWFEVLISVLRSVARRRLVETEHPSACATVDWKLWQSARALS